MEPPDALRAFRRSFYDCLHRRSDALFELADAILTADSAVPSPVHLSLQASHRRGWGSLYAALDRGRIDAQALRRLIARHPLAGSQTPVYAVDVSVWPSEAGDAELIWRSYVRRFDLEHTFRFLKQTLGWITPRVRHPEQADRWTTWLVVVAAFTQLRLARTCVADRRLPWERRYDTGRLIPVRIRRVVSALLAELGTPAKPPKPCGRSPGRPKGHLSGQAKRYPAIKKST